MRTSALLVVVTAGLWSVAPVASEQASPASAVAALWQAPRSLHDQDLFYGPWGAERAPNPSDTYTLVRRKHGGVSTGVVVRDSRGRTWHVKQGTKNGKGVEGPAEVAISRVLSAVGYHQPPVYYLPTFRLSEASGSHVETGGRFRLDEPTLRAGGSWGWQKNEFVGTQPYNGLLAILLAFNSWDLKDSNNTLYEVRRGRGVETWYVVRDLGGALGEAGGLSPHRNDIDKFERARYVEGVRHGLVEFDYHGKRSELVRSMPVGDVAWAMSLLAGLSDQQWRDAFRAGGYPDDVARRFIRKIHTNILEAQQLSAQTRQTARKDE